MRYKKDTKLGVITSLELLLCRILNQLPDIVPSADSIGMMLTCRQTVVENKDDVCCNGASALGCFTDWGMTEGEGP